MGEGADRPVARMWFVQAAERVWGPYPEARIEAFVDEGRVAPETLVSTDMEGPFHPAAHQAGLYRLFGDATPSAPPSELEVLAPEPARALVVWAGLRSQRPERFEQGLAIHGPYVRIGPDLWLLRARIGPAGLRNALTRRLDPSDSLMVVEAPLDQAAWFNLDGAADRTMRQLWAGAEA